LNSVKSVKSVGGAKIWGPKIFLVRSAREIVHLNVQ